jgi:hypothetical protein
MRFLIAGVLGIALLSGACSKSGETPQEREVRAALESHLQKRGNLALNNMNMEIQSVKLNGDSADAQVRFQSKQKPDLAVGIHYVLRRAGDHWEVESSSPIAGMGADSHQSTETPSTPGAAPNTSPPAGAKPEASH